MMPTQNPYVMPQMPQMMPPLMNMMNPYQNCYYPMGANMMYNPLPGYYDQQMRNYQMFYGQYQGQYQPSINIDLFQHQG